MMPQSQSQIDPGVEAVMHGILQNEGANENPSAKGDKNAQGQYTAAGVGMWSNDDAQGHPQALPANGIPSNFVGDAQKYGLDPTDFSIENQKKVMYMSLATDKAAGLSPAQILSKWNSGGANTYASASATGTGSVGHYNVATYVNNGLKAAQDFANKRKETPLGNTTPAAPSSSVTAQDFNPIPNPADIVSQLGQNIASRFTQGSQALNLAASGGTQGNLPALGSGILQTAGAAAGGIGDIVNAGLQTIPGVQSSDKLTGKAISALAGTPWGKSISQGLGQLIQQHPYVSGDIGAAVNIGSLIPIFKGLSLARAGVGDAVTTAFKGNLQEGVVKELTAAVAPTARDDLARSAQRGLQPIQYVLQDPETVPAIVPKANGIGFKYSTGDQVKALESSITNDEQQLQEKLTTPEQSGAPLMSLDNARKGVLASVKKAFALKGGYTAAVKWVDNYFNSLLESDPNGRTQISASEMNGVKRDIRGQAFDTLSNTDANKLKKVAGSSLKNQIETYATQNGIQGVSELNQSMGLKQEAIDFLENLNDRSVQSSGKGNALKEIAADVGGAAGEGLGGAVGLPYAGTLAGRGIRAIFGSSGMPSTPLASLISRGTRGGILSSIGRGVLKTQAGVGLQGIIGLPNKQQ